MSRNVGLGMIVCLETVWLVFDCVWMLYSCTSRWFTIHGCCLTVYVETVLLQDCVCVLYGCCVMGYFIRNIILSLPPGQASQPLEPRPKVVDAEFEISQRFLPPGPGVI